MISSSDCKPKPSRHVPWRRPSGRCLSLLLLLVIASASTASAADLITVRAGHTTYRLDPTTLEINASNGGADIPVMPALHAPEPVIVTHQKDGWRWSDADGHRFRLTREGDALRLIITGAPETSLSWPMPPANHGTWLIPDGEGMAYSVSDPFWQSAYTQQHCLGGTTALSFPAWSYLSDTRAVTYALGDGLQSKLCLHEDGGLQTRLEHDFSEGAERLDLLFSLQAPDPLAPALYYRRLMKARGQFISLKDKFVPDLPRLFGAPQAYVWGDGRDLAFLDDLKALGISRITLSYDQDPNNPRKHLIGPDYLKKAYAQGYLAGPYESFDNAQPPATADSPSAIWSHDLYPSGCLHKADGQIMAGFANRGCELSSAAVAAHPHAISPASRYAAHVKDGASEVFVDVDGFGEFFHDYNPARPMTMSEDRVNRLTRLGLGIAKYHLVLGSENVTAWSSGVAHFSHGTAEAHVNVLWPIQSDHKRFGGYWPPEQPPLFFDPIALTPDEMRLLFGPADRLPLFEAAFHDSVIASDRWEVGLMKIKNAERQRFTRALLYGTPTMWNLNRKELARVGLWLKAAQDDFRIAHGDNMPVALTGFQWLSPDHLVQQARFADGRVLTANFSDTTRQGLKPDCLRVERSGKTTAILCPPPEPAAYP